MEYIFSLSFEPYSKLGYASPIRDGCQIQLPDRFLERKSCKIEGGPAVYDWETQKVPFWESQQNGTAEYFETSIKKDSEEIVEKKFLKQIELSSKNLKQSTSTLYPGTVSS